MAKYWKWGCAALACVWAVLLGMMLGQLWNVAHAAGRPGGFASPPQQKAPDPLVIRTEDSNLSRETVNRMKGYWTVAVFGVDSREGTLKKGTRSDMEMICNINLDTGEVRLVSIYRDTFLRIDENHGYDKINQAYFFGGPAQAVSALDDNLDIKVDDYVAFSWKSVADAINILGGIDVDITKEEFRVINGFITETVESTGVGSHQLKKAGPNHLDGVQAVAYARLRKMDTDFKRTERQRKVAELVLKKLREADFATLKQLVSAVLPQVLSSVTVTDVIPVLKTMNQFHLTETAGFPFHLQDAMVGKKDCVIPVTLEKNVKELHHFLFGVEEYEPSGEVKEISRQIERRTK